MCRGRLVQGLGPGQVADAEAGAAEVVTAALALAPPGFPAERQLVEPLAAEERGAHADVAGVIPVFPAVAACRRRSRPPARRTPDAVRGPSSSRATHSGPRTTSSSRNMTHGAVPRRFPSLRARAIVAQRLGSSGRRGPATRCDPTRTPCWACDGPPDVFTRRGEVAAQEYQVHFRRAMPAPDTKSVNI